jgi:hypothetical protein
MMSPQTPTEDTGTPIGTLDGVIAGTPAVQALCAQLVAPLAAANERLIAQNALLQEAIAAKDVTIARQAEELGALRDRMVFLEAEVQQQVRVYFANLLREIHTNVLAEDRARRRPWWAVWRRTAR